MKATIERLPEVLVRRSEFAKLACVVPSSITKAVQSGELYPHQSGLLDINYPANAIYIHEHAERAAEMRPSEEFTPFDTDYTDIWILIKMGKVYKPVMAIEFDTDADVAVREVHFSVDEDYPTVIEKADGIVKTIRIGKKSYQPYYSTLDKILEHNTVNR
jgi:hypothetical protein